MRAMLRSMALMVLGLGIAAPAAPLQRGDLLRDGMDRWQVEAENGQARVTIRGGVMDIDTRDGVTVWLRERIAGPVAIDYDVMAVSAGGANDAVSDVNAFWMAHDSAAPGGSALARRRDGAFASYDDLRTYYVGVGGNRNSTTRFRRYVGRTGDRPLRAQDDRRDAADLLVPNRWTHIRLIADGNRIAVERDGRMLFALDDAAPYRSGHFGLRTTKSHLRVRALQITRLTHHRD